MVAIDILYFNGFYCLSPHSYSHSHSLSFVCLCLSFSSLSLSLTCSLVVQSRWQWWWFNCGLWVTMAMVRLQFVGHSGGGLLVQFGSLGHESRWWCNCGSQFESLGCGSEFCFFFFVFFLGGGSNAVVGLVVNGSGNCWPVRL